jgi:hypothetical protein
MKEIIIESITKGTHTVKIDDCDLALVSDYKWYLKKRGDTFYAHSTRVINGKKKCIIMHRLILGITNSKVLVDHEDHNGLNNTRKNIRVCNSSQNSSNRTARKNCTSKYLGVSWCNTRKKWRATIQKGTKQKELGSFDDEKEAAKEYNRNAILVHGEYANLNKI